jgi:hypothetical protein
MWVERRSKSGNWKIEIGKSPESLAGDFAFQAAILAVTATLGQIGRA